MKFFQISFLIFLVLSNTSYYLYSQQTTELYTVVEFPAIPAKFCDLEENMKETSGIIYYGGSVWTINDSGGEPEIYKIDKTTGIVIQKVIILNGSNRDWEDITQDDDFIYVGDFGNNDGNRSDLKIYKIAKSEITAKKKVELNAKIIGLSYNDQKSFSESKHHHNFDCESMISYGDSLIVFSKDWEDGKTRMYKMPKIPGKYQLDPLVTFDADGLVTGADYNKDSKKLVLIGYKDRLPFIYYFRNFNGRKFESNQVYRFNLNKMKDSQTEGIAWLNDETIIFSTEQTKSFSQQVFELNFQSVFKLIGK
jgi:hypothetical protein